MADTERQESSSQGRLNTHFPLDGSIVRLIFFCRRAFLRDRRVFSCTVRAAYFLDGLSIRRRHRTTCNLVSKLPGSRYSKATLYPVNNSKSCNQRRIQVDRDIRNFYGTAVGVGDEGMLGVIPFYTKGVHIEGVGEPFDVLHAWLRLSVGLKWGAVLTPKNKGPCGGRQK